MGTNDEDKKIAWKSCHWKFLNKEFSCAMTILTESDTVSSVHRLKYIRALVKYILERVQDNQEECQQW